MGFRPGPLLAALGAGSKSLEASNDKKRQQQMMLEDRVAQKEMRELQKRSLEQALQPKPAPAVDWDTRETEDGVVQVNPRTGEVRPLKLEDRVLRPKPKPVAPAPSRTTDRGIEEFDPKTGQWTPTGRTPYQAPAKPDKPDAPKPAEFEKKAAFMIEGAERANQTLSTYQPTARTFISKVPGLGNYGVSEEEQVALQAAETLHDAYLRLTTGATINPEELRAAARQYVPLPGDKPGVIRAKHQRRAEIVRAIRAAAQPVLQQQGGVVPTPKAADHSAMSDEDFAKAWAAGAFKKP